MVRMQDSVSYIYFFLSH